MYGHLALTSTLFTPAESNRDLERFFRMNISLMSYRSQTPLGEHVTILEGIPLKPFVSSEKVVKVGNGELKLFELNTGNIGYIDLYDKNEGDSKLGFIDGRINRDLFKTRIITREYFEEFLYSQLDEDSLRARIKRNYGINLGSRVEIEDNLVSKLVKGTLGKPIDYSMLGPTVDEEKVGGYGGDVIDPASLKKKSEMEELDYSREDYRKDKVELESPEEQGRTQNSSAA